MSAQINNQTYCTTLPVTIFPANYNVEKIYFTILFSLYLTIASFGTLISNIIINLSPLVLGLFALMLLCTKIKREYVPIYVYVGFLAMFLLISSLIVGRTGGRVYFPFLFIFSSTGIAMILIRGYVYSWGGYIAFYSLAVYILMLNLDGVDPSVMGGRNAISIAMLIPCITLYIISSSENKKIDLKPALITLAISIWGVGRSGIVSSCVLLLGLLFVRFRDKKKYMLIFLVSAYLFRDAIFAFIMNQSFFKNAIFHYLNRGMFTFPSRWEWWSLYITNLNIFRLIFGVNVLEDLWPEGAKYAFNYHNSFVHLHLQTGFMGLITMALIFFALFKYFRTNKVFFFLLLSFILRASMDSFVFFSRADFILFFFIFYFLKSMSFRFPYISLYQSLPEILVNRSVENDQKEISTL